MKLVSNSLITTLALGASLTLPAIALAGPKTSQLQHVTKAKNEVVLEENSAQEANLKIEPVVEIVAPTTAPLNGKIAFDENYTSRVSSSILGRAIKINAQLGDHVKAGQTLVIIDSPDLGSAMSDFHKARADLDLKKSLRSQQNVA